MDFDDKIESIYKYLYEKEDKKQNLCKILDDLDISYTNDDLNEFRNKLGWSNHFDWTDLPKLNVFLYLNRKGIKYYEKLPELKEKRKMKEQIEILQYEDLNNKIKSFENQTEFWKSSIERNTEHINLMKDQSLYVYIAIGISILSLLISIFK